MIFATFPLQSRSWESSTMFTDCFSVNISSGWLLKWKKKQGIKAVLGPEERVQISSDVSRAWTRLFLSWVYARGTKMSSRRHKSHLPTVAYLKKPFFSFSRTTEVFRPSSYFFQLKASKQNINQTLCPFGTSRGPCTKLLICYLWIYAELGSLVGYLLYY